MSRILQGLAESFVAESAQDFEKKCRARSAVAERAGMHAWLLYQRITRGWPIELALSLRPCSDPCLFRSLPTLARVTAKTLAELRQSADAENPGEVMTIRQHEREAGLRLIRRKEGTDEGDL
jgi:hypothetical protein